jgi:hypothetical protein
MQLKSAKITLDILFKAVRIELMPEFYYREVCYSRTLFARFTVAELAPGPGRISS